MRRLTPISQFGNVFDFKNQAPASMVYYLKQIGDSARTATERLAWNDFSGLSPRSGSTHWALGITGICLETLVQPLVD